MEREKLKTSEERLVEEKLEGVCPENEIDEFEQRVQGKVLKKEHIKDFTQKHKHWNDDVWENEIKEQSKNKD